VAAAMAPSLQAPVKREFVALAALMMALFALSLDIVLPSLSVIGRDLNVQHINDSQLIISFVIVGMAVGQIFYGPVSDAVGRKPAIFVGLALFAAGCALCLFAADFQVMLAGRFLQGVGAAGPRIVTLALVRDQYEGPAMARIMSIVIAVFMVGPLVAPFLGQGIVLVVHWRVLFAVLLAVSVVLCVWLAWRQPETLPKSRRLPFSWRPISAALRETCASRVALGYSIAAGCVFGELFAFVASAPQIFLGQYGVGSWFPFLFSVSGLAIALASIVNARLVARVPMQHLCQGAAIGTGIVSALFFIPATIGAGTPALWMTMVYLSTTFFLVGILFGNMNALAMEPLGHIAGAAAGIVGSLTWFLAMIFGTLISQSYDGTIQPLVAGIGVLSAASIGAMRWAEAGRSNGKQP